MNGSPPAPERPPSVPKGTTATGSGPGKIEKATRENKRIRDLWPAGSKTDFKVAGRARQPNAAPASPAAIRGAFTAGRSNAAMHGSRVSTSDTPGGRAMTDEIDAEIDAHLDEGRPPPNGALGTTSYRCTSAKVATKPTFNDIPDRPQSRRLGNRPGALTAQMDRPWIYSRRNRDPALCRRRNREKLPLKLQLAVARALARDWIGLLPEPGRTLVLSCEDDLKEMKRRLYGILKFYLPDIKDAADRWKEIGDIRLVDLVGADSILGLPSKGTIIPTEMYRALGRYISDFKPGLVCLDVLADLFGGDEIVRTQVRQFMNLLHALCLNHHCAILLLAHPSRAGMNTRTGTSGSTDWHNSVRARTYWKRRTGRKINASSEV